MATFRLAHISDLHFGIVADHLNPLLRFEGKARAMQAKAGLLALLKGTFRTGKNLSFYPSTFTINAALNLLESLSPILPTLDAVIATGDLATTGDDADLRLARDYFHGVLPSEWNPEGVRVKLVDEASPMAITLPGNHDQYEGVALVPGSTRFEQHIGSHWDFDKDWTYSIPGTSPRIRVTTIDSGGVTLVICLADFSLETHNSGEGALGWWGQGRATRELIGDLVTATKVASGHAKGSQQRPVVLWALHFPPAFPGVIAELQLLNDDEVVAAAQSCRVSAILAGHTHRTLMYDAAHGTDSPDPPVLVVCSGPSCGLSAHGEFGFSVIEVDATTPDVRVTPTHYEWEKASRLFVAKAAFPRA